MPPGPVHPCPRPGRPAAAPRRWAGRRLWTPPTWSSIPMSAPSCAGRGLTPTPCTSSPAAGPCRRARGAGRRTVDRNRSAPATPSGGPARRAGAGRPGPGRPASCSTCWPGCPGSRRAWPATSVRRTPGSSRSRRAGRPSSPTTRAGGVPAYRRRPRCPDHRQRLHDSHCRDDQYLCRRQYFDPHPQPDRPLFVKFSHGRVRWSQCWFQSCQRRFLCALPHRRRRP